MGIKRVPIKKLCSECGRALKKGAVQCICGALMLGAALFGAEEPHREIYRPVPVQTITVVATTTSSSSTSAVL